MISTVPPELFDSVWRQVLPMVERGLKKGAGDTTSADDFRTAVLSGNAVMWAVHDDSGVDAVIIWRILQYPAKKVLFVDLIAGKNFEAWSDEAQELLQDHAQIIGAKAIEATIRPGLSRILPEKGWKTKAIIMRLENGRHF